MKRHQDGTHRRGPGCAGGGRAADPAAIAGTDRITRLGPLRVAYGAPVELEDLRTRMREAAQIGTDRLMAAIESWRGRVKPLLVVDGDSLAHRAYHVLPKTIKRAKASSPARSSASRTSPSGSGRRSSRGAWSSAGTCSRCRRTGTRRISPTKPAASSTRRSWSSAYAS